MGKPRIRIIEQEGAREFHAIDDEGMALRLVEADGETYAELIHSTDGIEFIESAGPFGVSTVAGLRDWALDVAPPPEPEITEALGAILIALGPVVWILSGSWSTTWRVVLAYALIGGVVDFIARRRR